MNRKAAAGNKVAISMSRDSNGVNWTSTMSMGSSSTKDSFPLGYKNFNQVSSSLLANLVLWTKNWGIFRLCWQSNSQT